MTRMLTVTRISNACCLLQSAHHAVLTDPWFTQRWHLHRGEPLGMTVAQLPRLSAVVVSHYFINHWDPEPLAQLNEKATTPLLVCTANMLAHAHQIGFTRARQVAWGQTLELDDGLSVEVVEAHISQKEKLNNYVLTMDGVRVFFGGEARDLEPLRRYAQHAPSVDVALLPVNGLTVMGGPQLVMGPADALDAARILGARNLGCIHDATGRDVLWAYIRRRGSTAETLALAKQRGDRTTVLPLVTGRASRVY